MSTKRLPVPVLWIVIWSIVALLVISCFSAWWFLDNKWQEMVTRTAEGRAWFEARGGERPVLWGQAEPGGAFEAYRDALALMNNIDGEFRKLDDSDPRLESYLAVLDNWNNWKTLADVSDVSWRTVERLEPAFVLVHKGAHCRDGRRRIPWESGGLKIGIHIYNLSLLGQHARLKAWRCLEEGRHIEGIRLLLDLLQFGFDSFADPTFCHRITGAASIRQTLGLFVVCWDPDEEATSRGTAPAPRVSLEHLEPEARALLRTGLTRLARRNVPSLSDTMRAEAVLVRWAAELPDVMEAGSAPFSDGVGGRFLVSDAVDRMWEWADKLDGVEDRWPVLNALLNDWESDQREQWNPLYLASSPGLRLLAEEGRKTCIVIRVTLMALSEVDVDKHLLILTDPFGTKIRRRAVGDRTHYWSVGVDGIDQEGDPEKDVVFVR